MNIPPLLKSDEASNVVKRFVEICKAILAEDGLRLMGCKTKTRWEMELSWYSVS